MKSKNRLKILPMVDIDDSLPNISSPTMKSETLKQQLLNAKKRLVFP
jgi:hypothetical protein